jgi:hypothetical protein
MRTIVTAALQRQYLQTELILWIRLVLVIYRPQEAGDFSQQGTKRQMSCWYCTLLNAVECGPHRE